MYQPRRCAQRRKLVHIVSKKKEFSMRAVIDKRMTWIFVKPWRTQTQRVLKIQIKIKNNRLKCQRLSITWKFRLKARKHSKNTKKSTMENTAYQKQLEFTCQSEIFQCKDVRSEIKRNSLKNSKIFLSYYKTLNRCIQCV